MSVMAKPITGRRVLVWLLLFFGTIVAVNGAFVYFALDTWPGLSTRRAYEEGLAYNKTLDAARAQHALGWKSVIDVEGAESGGRALTVRMTDRGGAPVVGLAMTLELRRPVREDQDRMLVLVESGEGVYRAAVEMPPGRWQAAVKAVDPGGRTYRMTHDLTVDAEARR